MDVIDLLITIVVVTILVTIVLAVVTYVAYKLRLAREPSELDRHAEGLRYFVEFSPDEGGAERGAEGGAEGGGPAAPHYEEHATEA